MMTVPHYRERLFERLRTELEPEAQLKISTGATYFDSTVRTAPKFMRGSHYRVRNRYFLARHLAWQEGASSLTRDDDIVIVEFNPRIISNWMLGARSTLAGRHQSVLGWGHTTGRRGKGGLSMAVRGALRALVNGLVVYTEAEKGRVPLRYQETTHVAPNALYSAGEIRRHAHIRETNRTNLIYCGRLVEPKKPLLAIRGFELAIRDLPASSNLVIVGDGPLRSDVEEYVLRRRLTDRVEICGSVHDLATLAALYRECIGSISPGYVGLSAIQSLSFGVPMVFARDEPHAPEVDVLRPSWNSESFRSDDACDLADKLISLASTEKYLPGRRAAISKAIQDGHSIDAAVRGMARAIHYHMATRS